MRTHEVNSANRPRPFRPGGSACVSPVLHPPASYDAGGSAIDLSAATLGAQEGFTTVYGGHCLKAAHASTKIKLDAHVVSSATATAPLIVLRDRDGTDTPQLSGDVSGYTVTMEFVGV